MQSPFAWYLALKLLRELNEKQFGVIRRRSVWGEAGWTTLNDGAVKVVAGEKPSVANEQVTVGLEFPICRDVEFVT